jgi:hypothetical protein
MIQIPSNPPKPDPATIRLRFDGLSLEFIQAKTLATEKARALSKNAMLLSWCDRKAGRYHPTFECGTDTRPPWMVYAEARGGNLTIDINDGEFVFIYLML